MSPPESKSQMEGIATARADEAVKADRWFHRMLPTVWHKLIAGAVVITTLGAACPYVIAGGEVIADVVHMRGTVHENTNGLAAVKTDLAAEKADRKESDAKLEKAIQDIQADIRVTKEHAASTDNSIKDLRDGQNEIIRYFINAHDTNAKR